MSTDGAGTDEAEGQLQLHQSPRSPHQKQVHGPTCLQRRYDPPPLPPRLRAKRDYEREVRAKHRYPPMMPIQISMPPNIVHFIPRVHQVHLPPMFHFNPPYSYDYPPHGPGFPANSPPPYLLPPPPPPLHVHHCPPPLPPPPPPPPPPPSVCLPPPLSIPSSPLHTQPGSPPRKQRPSKRARQKMRRRLERLRLEQEKVQEASVVASESGYETTGDHMTPATSLTPAQHPSKRTPLAVSKEGHVEIEEWEEEACLEEQVEGERERKEVEREEAEGREESDTDKTEETRKLQSVDATKPESLYTHDCQARIRSSSRSDSVSSATSIGGDSSLRKLLKDLHRCDISLTRHQAVLNERCEAGLQQFRAVFVVLRDALSSREETLSQEMTSTKQTAAMILQRRKETISYLRGAAEKSHLLEETQAQELRQQIKQFVTDRKVDEEIGRITRFQADPDDLLSQIMTFGKVLNAKLVYSSWEENVAAMIDQRTHRTDCGDHSSSSTPPPTSAEGELAPTRSEFDSAFLEELEHESAEPAREEASTASRPQPPAVAVTASQPEDDPTAVVESSTVDEAIAPPTESRPSQTDDSSSSASSTATASPSHSLSTGSAASLASPMSSSSLQSSSSHTPGSHVPVSHVPGSRTPGSHVPVSYIPGSHVPEPHTPGSHIPVSHVPGPLTQPFQSSRKSRAQKTHRESDACSSGDFSTRPKEATPRKSIVGSSEAGVKDDDSCGCPHKCPEDASRLSEHAGVPEKPGDIHSGKYSPEELAMIQERVRHSLQRQGVLLYDPLTGNGPVRMHKEQLPPDVDEPALRKKKTPTQLRRERKKRQKERERRQREMERRTTERPLRAQEVSVRHPQASFGRTNPTGKGTDDSSSTDSPPGACRSESLTLPTEQRKKKRNKWRVKGEKTKPATTQEMDGEKESQPVAEVNGEQSQVCCDAEKRPENGGVRTNMPPPGITNDSSQVLTELTDNECGEAPEGIGVQSDRPGTLLVLQTYEPTSESETPREDQGLTAQSPVLDFTAADEESDGAAERTNEQNESPSTQVGPSSSRTEAQVTEPKQQAGSTADSQPPPPATEDSHSTPPPASPVDRTPPPPSQSQTCPTALNEGHEPLSDQTHAVNEEKQAETTHQPATTAHTHAEEELPETDLVPKKDEVEAITDDSLTNPSILTKPTDLEHQLTDLLPVDDTSGGTPDQPEPGIRCKPNLRPEPTQHEE